MSNFEDGAEVLLLWITTSTVLLILWGILSWIVVSIVRHRRDPSSDLERDPLTNFPKTV
jgi:hypothetical protein